ncbi:reverse transcriptase domain-containing protein [Tanacetum coccineum]
MQSTRPLRRPPTDQLTSAEESNREVRPHAEKVHKKKAQQDKLKEVKVRLNFERCSGRNSKIQEVSQNSESKTPNIRGEHKRGTKAAAKVERWAMPTWYHMFNSTLTGSARVWFDDLPQESVDSYDDLKKAFLANFLQQKKCIKDPVEIHHIKQREGESTEDFVQRFKTETRHVKGASKCMRISGFMHKITKSKLIKRPHEKIPKSVDEMMRITTSSLRGEVASSNQVRKKTLSARKQQEAGRKQNFDRMGDFRNQ